LDATLSGDSPGAISDAKWCRATAYSSGEKEAEWCSKEARKEERSRVMTGMGGGGEGGSYESDEDAQSAGSSSCRASEAEGEEVGREEEGREEKGRLSQSSLNRLKKSSSSTVSKEE
jgi:hypothetical protein